MRLELIINWDNILSLITLEHLLGQLVPFSTQFSVSVADPGQDPPFASKVVFVLVFLFLPTPQVFEHALHVVHEPHSQSAVHRIST